MVAQDMNPVWVAQSRLRRRKFDACIDTCTSVLNNNPYDQAVWYLKTRALTLKDWIDDTEMGEEGIGDALLDEHNMAQVARPGTSLTRPMSSAGSGSSQALCPMTASGRPVTGFVRPGTGSARPGTGAKPGTAAALEAAMKGARPGTSRPVTSSGRFVRLGTASMLSQPGGPFIALERLDLRKYALRPALARVLLDYMLYAEHDVRRATELAGLATVTCGYEDWWWKARLGQCYLRLGLLRDCEKQLSSALRCGGSVACALQLAHCYLRMDQPTAALELYKAALERQPGEVSLLVGTARVQEALGQAEEAEAAWRAVLAADASNVEAVASLAAQHFYGGQPEVALRLYRRLLQMGVQNAEVWANLGLCCFHSGQYDMALPCMERALAAAGDDVLPDVWYNMSLVAVGIGDLPLAQQCLQVAVALDPDHAEALNNLGVIQARRGEEEAALGRFKAGQRAAPHVYELAYNAALLRYRASDLQAASQLVAQALEAYPEHAESLELQRLVRQQLASL